MPPKVGLLGDTELPGNLGRVSAPGQQPVGLDQLAHDLLRRVSLPRCHGDGAFLPTLVGRKDSHTTRTNQRGSRHLLDPCDAVRGEVLAGAGQERRAGRALLVGVDLAVGQAGMVIDG